MLTNSVKDGQFIYGEIVNSIEKKESIRHRCINDYGAGSTEARLEIEYVNYIEKKRLFSVTRQPEKKKEKVDMLLEVICNGYKVKDVITNEVFEVRQSYNGEVKSPRPVIDICGIKDNHAVAEEMKKFTPEKIELYKKAMNEFLSDIAADYENTVKKDTDDNEFIKEFCKKFN